MDFLAPFHPQIVHTPIALLIFSAFFAIVGRLFDREWLRKAAMLMLVFGTLGAYFAIESGKPAHRVPEHEQGVSEEAIHEHSDIAHNCFRFAVAALIAYAIATRLKGGPQKALVGAGLVLQTLAAVGVGLAGKEGGELVYEHGANVRVAGELVKTPGFVPRRRGEAREAAPPADTATAH